VEERAGSDAMYPYPPQEKGVIGNRQTGQLRLALGINRPLAAGLVTHNASISFQTHG
jgi:hypothetical protein